MAPLLIGFAVLAAFVIVMVRRSMDIVQVDPGTPRDMAQVARLAVDGRLINAIQIHRELTGMSLKDSKAAVEKIVRLEAAPPPQPEADALIRRFLRDKNTHGAMSAASKAYGPAPLAVGTALMRVMKDMKDHPDSPDVI